jgi:hypothetical protein
VKASFNERIKILFEVERVVLPCSNAKWGFEGYHFLFFVFGVI